MKTFLVTGADYKYLNKIIPYLQSVQINSNFDENILIFIGENKIQNNLSKLRICNITDKEIEAKNINNCLQHGTFLNCKEFDSMTNEEDIICFTDGDMNLQRALNEDENTFIRSLKEGDVYIGYNESPEDTLAKEALRLTPTGFIDAEIGKSDWNKIKVYNTGIIVMNKKTWQILFEKYKKLFPEVDKMFKHYAKQQWLISYIIGSDKIFKITEMSYEIHNHSHYPPAKGTEKRANGELFYNNKKVLFKHRWY